MNIHLYLLLLVLSVSSSEALSVLAPRAPIGGGGGGAHGGGGGGSHGGGGGGGHASGGSESSGGSHSSGESGSIGGSHESGGDSGSSGGGGTSGGASGSGGGDTGSGGAGSGDRVTQGPSLDRGGSGNTGFAAVTSTYTSRAMNYFSSGGGNRFTIPSGNAFAGRQTGGGTRDEVPGTPRYASGYPYYVNNPQTRGVYGNPFPFGYWPIYWHGYGYSDEYGQNTSVAAQRPGGNLSMVNLAPGPGFSNYTSLGTLGNNTNTYWMVGDYQTVQAVLSLIVDSQGSHPYACGVKDTTILPFNSSDPALPFHIQNVMQWYRSSSFALAYTGYNNTYATAPLNETTTLDKSSPFPADQVNPSLLLCVNTTVSASIAILDGGPKQSTAGQIAGIVVGSLVGAILVGIGAWYLIRKQQQIKYEKLNKPEQ